jgi:hypothetical protein
MNKTIQILAGALACAALACGGGSARQDASVQQPENLPGKAAVRLLGANAAGFESVVVSVEELSIEVDGHPVPVAPSYGAFDLTATDNAWLLGTFDDPSHGMVKVRCRLGAKGTYSYRGKAGAIDARGLPFEFEAPASFFANAHHEVFVLDVGRSLVDGCPGTKLLVPQLVIAF